MQNRTRDETWAGNAWKGPLASAGQKREARPTG